MKGTNTSYHVIITNTYLTRVLVTFKILVVNTQIKVQIEPRLEKARTNTEIRKKNTRRVPRHAVSTRTFKSIIATNRETGKNERRR